MIVKKPYETIWIPQLWVKVVLHSSPDLAVAILMSEDTNSLPSYCKEKNRCIQFDVLGDVTLFNHICCSHLTKEIKELFGTNWDVRKFLMGIEGITKGKSGK